LRAVASGAAERREQLEPVLRNRLRMGLGSQDELNGNSGERTAMREPTHRHHLTAPA
jgi:hypothetical protein